MSLTDKPLQAAQITFADADPVRLDANEKRCCTITLQAHPDNESDVLVGSEAGQYLALDARDSLTLFVPPSEVWVKGATDEQLNVLYQLPR